MASHGKSRKQLIQICRTVRRTHLYSLFYAGIKMAFFLQRICQHTHISLGRPSQRYTHQYRTVTVTPTNIGRGFLMGNKAEIGSGVRIAESGNGRSQFHHSRNSLTGGLGQGTIFQHDILPVFHHTHVDMQSRTCLSCCNFGSKGHIISQLVGKVADNPFGYHQLVGSLLHINRQEFNLVLLIDVAIQCKVSHLGMSILYLPARLGNVRHALSTEFIELGIRSRFMIATLVGCLEYSCIGSYDIVFQLTHCLELHAGYFGKCLACLMKGMLGSALQRFAVLIEEGTQHGQRRYFGKRVNKGRSETGNDVKVTAACFYK